MRGTSADSLAAVQERVRPLLSGPDASTLGDEMFAVARVLDSSGTLRRALTDPNAEGSAKAELAHRLFTGKISETTLDVLGGLVRSRWSASRDLGDACEALGIESLIAAADHSPGRLDQLEDDLFRFGRIVEGDPKLRAVIADRSAPAQRKATLVARLLHGKVGPHALVLIRQAAAYPRGRRFEELLDEMGKVAAAYRQRAVATVTSAVPLTADQQDRLTAALTRLYGKGVHLNIDIDPQVVGGIRVQIGDETIDGTVVGRLSEARRRLTGQ